MNNEREHRRIQYDLHTAIRTKNPTRTPMMLIEKAAKSLKMIHDNAFKNNR